MAHEQLRRKLGSATVWHVNSTATGGGVAELLHSTLRAHRDLGIRANWHVIDGDAEFFDVTKLIHHRLHGSPGPAGALNEAARAVYEATTTRAAKKFAEQLRPGDLVVLHDPQTLGMAGYLVSAGARVIWRLHIGTGARNDQVTEAWEFLRPYLPPVSRYVFSLAAFAPSWLDPNRVAIFPPSIDALTTKNRFLSPDETADVLAAVGLSQRSVGTFPVDVQNVRAISRVIQDGVLPETAPAVVQVSRWDPLKDMSGVLRAFVDHVTPRTDAHLVLAGPDPADIPDDPEGVETFDRIQAARAALDPTNRARIHLAVLSLKDTQANALAVNAVQRRADVVVQHSLREGFGLTVTEAMWKARPIVASNVDGIARQIEHETHGLLTSDPADLAELGDAIVSLLTNPEAAFRLGAAARRRCEREFLLPRENSDYLALYNTVLE